MTGIIDLASARARRRPRPSFVENDGTAVDDERFAAELQWHYARLVPGIARFSMPLELRQWLLAWAQAHRFDISTLRQFVCQRAIGLAATLNGAERDPDTTGLLAPEVLVLLWGLEAEPFSLRADWPSNRGMRELKALADLFGRPYSA